VAVQHVAERVGHTADLRSPLVHGCGHCGTMAPTVVPLHRWRRTWVCRRLCGSIARATGATACLDSVAERGGSCTIAAVGAVLLASVRGGAAAAAAAVAVAGGGALRRSTIRATIAGVLLRLGGWLSVATAAGIVGRCVAIPASHWHLGALLLL
jgi:hypothetical protein